MAATIGRSYCRMFHCIHGIKHLPSCHPAIYNGQLNANVKGVFRSSWYRSIFGLDKNTSDKAVQDTEPEAPQETGPTKPRRPPNVYVMYMMSIQDDLRKANPGMTFKELSTEASRRWQELDPEEKARLMLERRELNEKYKADQISYVENMTPEQIQEEEEEKQRKALKKLKKARKELGMPKKPWSAFTWFVSEKYPQQAGKGTNAEQGTQEPQVLAQTVFKQITDQWKVLPDSEREVYYDKSRESRERYLVEMADWEESMIEAGHLDVLRVSTLKKLKQAEGKTTQSKKKNKVIYKTFQ